MIAQRNEIVAREKENQQQRLDIKQHALKEAQIDQKFADISKELVAIDKALRPAAEIQKESDLAEKQSADQSQEQLAQPAIVRKTDGASLRSEQSRLKEMAVAEEARYLEQLPAEHLKALSESAGQALADLKRNNPSAKEAIQDQRYLCEAISTEIHRREMAEQNVSSKAAATEVAPKADLALVEQQLERKMVGLQDQSAKDYVRWTEARASSGPGNQLERLAECAALERKLVDNFGQQSMSRKELAEIRAKQDPSLLAIEKKQAAYLVSDIELVEMLNVEKQMLKSMEINTPKEVSELVAQAEIIENIEKVIDDRKTAAAESVAKKDGYGYERTAEDDKIDMLRKKVDSIPWIGDKYKSQREFQLAMAEYKGNDPAKQLHGAFIKEDAMQFRERNAQARLFSDKTESASTVKSLQQEIAKLKIDRAENAAKIQMLVGRQEALKVAAVAKSVQPTIATPSEKKEVLATEKKLLKPQAVEIARAQAPAGETLVAFGPDHYKHDKNNTESFYVTTRDAHDNERTRWGIDLERAVTESNVKVGDRIMVAKDRQKPVTVHVEVRDEVGKVTGMEDKDALKNFWTIDKIQAEGPAATKNSSVKEDSAVKAAGQGTIPPERTKRFAADMDAQLARVSQTRAAQQQEEIQQQSRRR